MRTHTLAALAAAILGGASSANAALTYYTADLQPLNGSNVTGNAVLILDDVANTLSLTAQLNNLEPNGPHNGHIHGRFDADGNPADSVTPTLANDADGDGFIEVGEGLSSYGDVLAPFSTTGTADNDPATITPPTTPNGTLVFTQVFDLSDEGQFFSPLTMADYDAADLFPLNFREIVFHGMTVASGVGAGTGGEVDGSGGYKAILPVTAGVIVGSPVPEPTTAAVLGLAGAGLLARRRRA